MPTGHAVQLIRPSISFEKVPPVHLSHTAAAVSDRLPASQSVHSDAREPDERPAVHSSHTAWPLRLRLNFPLAHSEHVAEAVAAA